VTETAGRRLGKRPGPKPRISRESIIEAATRVDPLTIGSVAAVLGVSPGSLYRHVEGLEDLTRGAAEHLFVTTPLPGADLDWRAYLEAEARNRLELLRSYPALFADPAADLTAVATDRLTAMVKALEERGFSTAAAVLATDAVIDLLHDGARQALAIRPGDEPAAGFPEEIRAVMAEILADPWSHLWRKLQLVLDGIERQRARLAAARREGSGSQAEGETLSSG
jgi:AcrR family transcriptional regulator